MNHNAEEYLESRRAELGRALGKPLTGLASANGSTLPEATRDHLREEAVELYTNELEWEHITDEERLDDGSLTELAFPGFLAFIRGLLLRETLHTVREVAKPRPEVVEDVLGFLAGRVIELTESLEAGDDPDEVDRTRSEKKMTAQLVDLVLLRLHEVDPGDL